MLYQIKFIPFKQLLQVKSVPSTHVKPNQMKLDFVVTNDKASYGAKGDSICLFSVAKEMTLNEQQIKPCVPYATQVVLSNPTTFKRVHYMV